MIKEELKELEKELEEIKDFKVYVFEWDLKQRNWYSLEEFVKWFLSGKYKKRCGNYYKN